MNQFYFIDACRSQIKAVKDLASSPRSRQAPDSGDVFEIVTVDLDNRIAPIFFAAAPGRETYGNKGGLTTFGKDVLNCLKNDAGDLMLINQQKRWVCTIDTLARSLRHLTSAYNAPFGYEIRRIMIEKWTNVDRVLHYLESPPTVKCRFILQPDDIHDAIQVFVLDASNRPPYEFPRPFKPNPHDCEIPAGTYLVEGCVVDDRMKPFYSNLRREYISVTTPLFPYTLSFPSAEDEQ